MTASLPIGVYAMSPVHGSLRRGDLVTFTLPTPLRIHCVAGEFYEAGRWPCWGCGVSSTRGLLRINGEEFGPVLPDAPAYALREGECITVEEGQVFTASHTPRSYDSRYFGTVDLAAVQRSIPVFTW